MYTFDDAEVPAPYSLDAKYVFHVYSEQQSPAAGSGPARASLQSVKLNLERLSSVAAEQDDFVELVLMPWEEFAALVDSHSFCHNGKFLKQFDSNVGFTMTLAYPQAVQEEVVLERGGAYVLLVSNCGGELAGATLSGSVVVRNPYGYLDGREYWKLLLYGGAAVAYVVVIGVYLYVLLRGWAFASYIHVAMVLLGVIGAAEAFSWWLLFHTANNGGKDLGLDAFAEVLSILKVLYGAFLAVLLALGLGVTVPSLPCQTKCKVLALHALFAFAAVPKVSIFSMRSYLCVSTSMAIAAAAPMVITAALLFLWSASALQETKGRLMEGGHVQIFEVYEQLFTISCASCSIAFVALAGQVMLDSPGQGIDDWASHVVWNDGLSQFSFLAALCAAMYCTRPREEGLGSQVLGEEHQTQEADDEEVGGLLAVEPVSPMGSPGGRPIAETVGAAAATE